MSSPSSQRRALPVWSWILIGIAGLYLVLAYGILPRLGEWKAHRHPDLLDGSRITHTGSGIPGDPLNIALVGSETDVVGAMKAAGWRAADPLSWRSDVRIAVDTVFDKPDPRAPVS